MTHKIKRRDFLKVAGVTGLVAAFPAPAFAQAQNANSKLNVACIGTGGQGGYSLGGVSGENVVALCDTDANTLGRTAERFPQAKQFRDYRKMYDEIEKEIDAVTVCTPDHTHAAPSILGMKLGKHCYCEKPLAHNVKEVRDMMAIAREKNLATQMGTQIHAEANYRRVVELVRANAIGTINEVHVWCGSRWGGRPFSTETPAVPANLDWDLWLGPAPVRPYNPQYFGGAWRCYWAFGNGTLGDMACHYMDLPFWALGLRLPTTVEAFCETPATPEVAPAQLRVEYTFAAGRGRGGIGGFGSGGGDGAAQRPTGAGPTGAGPGGGVGAGAAQRPAGGGAGAGGAAQRPAGAGGAGQQRPAITLNWYDGGLKPSILKEKELPDWGSGVLFVGSDGMLMADYGQRILFPREKFANYQAPAETIPNSVGHHREWINACKTGSQPTCNFNYSGPLAETVLLGAVAFRTGKKLEWDAQNMRATNVPEADQYLSRTYRQGWEV
ncbi:MAG: Gfo/Idh/MocA family oxidoreductase [Planctomycetaceae bacterium]|nr:Gfo/Idh/MocA family oxidoreductase [Planctomycetaceae bacterium]